MTRQMYDLGEVRKRVDYILRQTNEDIRRAPDNKSKAEIAAACEVYDTDGKPHFGLAANTYAMLALVDEMRKT